MDADLIVSIIAAVCGLLGIAGFLQLGDARNWRRQDEERREVESAARRQDLARRTVGVRHEHALNKALDRLLDLKVIACAVVNGDEVLTARRMEQLDLKEHLNSLNVVASSLPETVRDNLCRCHDGGVAQLAEVLLTTPFPEERVEAMGVVPETWTKAEVGLVALRQYSAASELVTAIDVAENLVRDHLPV
ncbi:hypothetical protein AB0B66_15325 [Catellatospora sp. NPDC049111]|uniref:hypothetical protein n=1 Tax=Catellatospora sp. NPDC049111 TaxID=3155271 RepID=UPI0033DFFC1F